MKLIKNAVISDKQVLVNILFNDKIRNIGHKIPTTEVDETIDLEGMLLIPGCIDAHVHFNDPGFNQREDFLSGSTSAAWGGITTIVDMPCTSKPPVTNIKNLNTKVEHIDKKAVVDYALWGGIRGNDIPVNPEIIDNLWNEGVVGFKLYTISGMSSFTELSYNQIEAILTSFPEYLFAFHAEDKDVISASLNTYTKEQLSKPEYYVQTRPVEAEFTAVEKILELSQKNRIHFVHISSKKAAQLIIREKKHQDVTFETCPHYLDFTADDIPALLGRIKTAPPVKFQADRSYLRDTLAQGTIDYITTDHAGCNYTRDKLYHDFSRVYNGIPGIELMIPYLFSEFYLKNKVSLAEMIKLTSENQAKRLGLYPRKGSLEIGSDADFTILDLGNPFTVDENRLHSKGKYSPWNGKELNCQVAMTIIRGKTVFEKDTGILVKSGYGEWVKPR